MSAKRKIIPVFVPHLGCPNGCVFCNQRQISGTLKLATGKTVRRALEEGLKACGDGVCDELAFYGGSFTAIPLERQEELLEAAKPFLISGQIGSIRVSTRPDYISTDVIERLIGYGVRTIELGAQSMRDRVLYSSGRGHLARDVISSSHLIKSAGLKLIIQMMTGLPGDDDEGAIFSARAIAALGPDGVRIYPTVIIKDTALHGMWLRGDYQEHTVQDAINVCSQLIPIFERARIPVIRIGLNPTEDLSGGVAVAGSYHPAFGEQVQSQILLNKARELMKTIPPGSEVVIGVAPERVSAMTGQHKINIITLKKELKLKSLKVRAEEENDMGIHILIANN